MSHHKHFLDTCTDEPDCIRDDAFAVTLAPVHGLRLHIPVCSPHHSRSWQRTCHSSLWLCVLKGRRVTGLPYPAQVRGLGEMAANFGVDTAPALLVVCNGDPATADRYDGEFKSGPIRDFISKYAGGRKCASAVKVCMHCLCLPTHLLLLSVKGINLAARL